MLVDVVTAYVDGATAEGYAEDWDLEKLWDGAEDAVPGRHRPPRPDRLRRGRRAGRADPRRAARRADRGRRARLRRAREAELEEIAGEGAMRQLERNVLLNVIDRKWREHLYEMDYLKEGIGLRAMAQRDPLVEYQREGYDMFIGHARRAEGGVGRLPVQRHRRGGARARRRRRSPRRRGWRSSPRRPPPRRRTAPSPTRSGRGCGQPAANCRLSRRPCAPRELRTSRAAADLHRAVRGRVGAGAAATAAAKHAAPTGSSRRERREAARQQARGRQGQPQAASSQATTASRLSRAAGRRSASGPRRVRSDPAMARTRCARVYVANTSAASSRRRPCRTRTRRSIAAASCAALASAR